ncbi:MAG TPA: hypothetical protein VH370_16455 [Humisphaera sp.]|jgi:hypothetical protein|nr:hypothetical protein [Humisphaera sp.]
MKQNEKRLDFAVETAIDFARSYAVEGRRRAVNGQDFFQGMLSASLIVDGVISKILQSKGIAVQRLFVEGAVPLTRHEPGIRESGVSQDLIDSVLAKAAADPLAPSPKFVTEADVFLWLLESDLAVTTRLASSGLSLPELIEELNQHRLRERDAIPERPGVTARLRAKISELEDLKDRAVLEADYEEAARLEEMMSKVIEAG